MMSVAGEDAKQGEDEGTPTKARVRRAVYVTRVDNGGVEDAVIVGEDSVSPLRSDMIDARDEAVPEGESPEDRWLRDNVPPHW
ncbi:hypothetical protein [Schaalia sp. JY-X159]|jgi:hypothetical protein|uniref:hypothetical protein n=1 Tax=Schaalia sp. JY-X159 TaxID=2758575 RepID=UPI00165D5FE0|nr:hypothetical protein [Schaalia sp. JY-X159]